MSEEIKRYGNTEHVKDVPIIHRIAVIKDFIERGYRMIHETDTCSLCAYCQINEDEEGEPLFECINPTRCESTTGIISKDTPACVLLVHKERI